MATPGNIYGGNQGKPAAGALEEGSTATAGGRSLNTDQHAGSGPDLTASGVGVRGALTPNPPATDLALGKGTGNMVADLALIGPTFDKLIRLRNRWVPNYRQFVNVRAVREAAYPGSKVTIFRTGGKGLNLALTPLSEYADPDAKSLKGLEESMDITVDEYGDSTVVTQRLNRFSWAQINPMQVEQVRRQMMDTIDALYMNAIFSNTGGFNGKGFRQAFAKGDKTGIAFDGAAVVDPLFGSVVGFNTTVPAKGASATTLGKLNAAAIRGAVAQMRNYGVAPYANGLYHGFITPDQSVSLRETTDLAGWRYPHLEENANGNIWQGTVGVFEGVYWIEGPQYKGLAKGGTVPATTNNIINVFPGATAGDGSAGDKAKHLYDNILILGAEGITDVVVEEPHTVVTPTSDKFGRLAGLGWIGCLGTQVYDNFAGLLVAVDAS